jgi:uncharacterized MAPEG superfamily protein
MGVEGKVIAALAIIFLIISLICVMLYLLDTAVRW